MKRIVLILFFFSSIATAGEPVSFAWEASDIPCNNTDQVIAYPNRAFCLQSDGGTCMQGRIGASPWGSGVIPLPPKFKIVKVGIVHQTDDPNAFIVVGKTGHGGDYISRYVVGPVRAEVLLEFPIDDERPIYTDGDEFHVHAGCGRGKHSVKVMMRIITLP